MSGKDPSPMDAEGERLFDSMVRWRALATTTILMGFGAGFANLIVTSTGGAGSLARGLAALAVLLIATSVVSTGIGWRARRRFMKWYTDNAPN